MQQKFAFSINRTSQDACMNGSQLYEQKYATGGVKTRDVSTT